jgi:cytochrome c oxidase subunit 2
MKPRNQTTETKTMKFHKILIVSLSLSAFVVCAAPGKPKPVNSITITAKRFAFSPNEITVKKGEAVTLIIQSDDVSHGLVIEELGLRTEVKKGASTSVTITPERAGTFGGKCAHFCGSGHGSMTFNVHVVE